MLERPCIKNSPVLIKTESSRAEMRKLLPSHLTYTITKEQFVPGGKYFHYISSIYYLQLSSAKCQHISSRPPIFFFWMYH